MTPRVFILENVEGLVIHHPKFLASIIKRLKAIGNNHYNVTAKLLCASEHGIPHHRKRLWLVGIAKRYDSGSFCWPLPIGHVPIDMLLDPLEEKLRLR